MTIGLETSGSLDFVVLLSLNAFKPFSNKKSQNLLIRGTSDCGAIMKLRQNDQTCHKTLMNKFNRC